MAEPTKDLPAPTMPLPVRRSFIAGREATIP